MKSLADLIAKHPVPGVRQSVERGMVADIISRTLKVPVKPAQLMLEAGVLTLTLPPVLKSAILLKQHELQGELVKDGITLSAIR